MLSDEVARLDAWNLEEIADKRPNDYIYALMSNHVYGNIQKGDTLPSAKNWGVKRISADKSGYFGAIYINNKENHIVVAHRGTSSIRAVIEDIHGIVLNNISPQKEAAFELVREAIELAKKKNYSLSFTGHSLGAFLAE
ncbi:MAG: Mbeg1-like protein, partial [Gammaproteobacteria bacterium]